MCRNFINFISNIICLKVLNCKTYKFETLRVAKSLTLANERYLVLDKVVFDFQLSRKNVFFFLIIIAMRLSLPPSWFSYDYLYEQHEEIIGLLVGLRQLIFSLLHFFLSFFCQKKIENLMRDRQRD